MTYRFRIKDTPLREDGELVVWQAHLCHTMLGPFRYDYHEDYQLGVHKSLLTDGSIDDRIASSCFALVVGGVREFIRLVSSRCTHGPFRAPAIVPRLVPSENVVLEGWSSYNLEDIELKRVTEHAKNIATQEMTPPGSAHV